MISHRNVIANTLQMAVFESYGRKRTGVKTQTELGLLPMSHIYALVVICHTGVWRGDEVVVLPKFDLKTFLAAIQDYKIENLLVVCSGRC
jgi:acyl-CoA synthetase (AMP-forming)/AMP-acid ligase II